jgi:gamma-glutamylcyclotransferase (GGCT)/AIG2-like uncharacterized protein YtfP
MRLATYGTLGPGKPNHHHLSMIDGNWSTGSVRGFLHDAGWGADLGFPAIVLDPTGPEVSVDVLESEQLSEHLERLDDFEGPAYARVLTEVATSSGKVEAFIYVLAQ